MRINLKSMPYHILNLVYVLGYYDKYGKASFRLDMNVLIEINDGKNIRIHSSLDNTLKQEQEFTLAPTIVQVDDNNKAVACIPSISDAIGGSSDGTIIAKKAYSVNAPYWENMPIVLECKVTDDHFPINAIIKNVNVYSEFVDKEDGNIDLGRVFGFFEIINIVNP